MPQAGCHGQGVIDDLLILVYSIPQSTWITLLFLLFLLPIPAPLRAKYEARAYAIDVLTSLPSQRSDAIERIVDLFEGWDYYRMFPFREQTNSISNSNNSNHFNPRSNGKGMYHGASKALGDFPAVAAVKPSWQQKPLGHRPASQTQDPLGDEFTIEADYVCSNLA